MHWLLFAIFFACGALITGLSIPLIQRRVPPNGYYGLRVRATRASERVWYEANRRSGWDLLFVGSATMVNATIGLIFQWTAELQAWIAVGVLTIGVLLACMRGVRLANSLLADEQSRDAEAF